MRVAGIMSGTSLDGIDVAIIDISGSSLKTICHAGIPYPASVRARILAVSNADCHTSAISQLNFELGELYAKAVIETCRRRRVPLESVELAGSHGQTIFHKARGEKRSTLQIGESSVIAERLGIPVVSDFRTRDIAAGGQGAPLVPLVDYMLFRSATKSRVALNIGGIANVTVLPRKASPESVTAFDTGPGNMLIDQLVAASTHGKRTYDRDGRIAAGGRLNRGLLEKILKDRYFAAPPPKTAGREQYGKEFTQMMRLTGLPMNDLIATATVVTAATIATGVQRFAGGTEEVIVSGGGVHNRQMMAQICAFLPSCRVTTSAEFNVDPDAKEAIAFAFLAYRTWKRKTGNLPSATGARRAVPLGKVTFEAENKISVVVVSFNRARHLRRLLQALRLPEGLQVVVVDNGSGDGAADLSAEFLDVRFSRLPRNFGLTRALNIGIRAAERDHVLLLHDDVTIDGSAVIALAAYLESHPEAGAVCPKLNTPQVRSLPTPSDPDPAPHPAAAGDETAAECVSGAAIMFRTAFLRAMGQIDERYGNYGSDIELCAQVRSSSRRIVVLNAVAAQHDSVPSPMQASFLEGDRMAGTAAFLGKYHGFSAGLLYRLGNSLKALITFRFSVLAGAKIDGSR